MYKEDVVYWLLSAYQDELRIISVIRLSIVVIHYPYFSDLVSKGNRKGSGYEKCV